jgi:hypothetical protein
MKQTYIREYIRDANNQPRGVVIAIRLNDEVLYGYSLLNTDKDKFDKNLGLTIAANRAYSGEFFLPDVPERQEMVIEAIKRIQTRAIRYFKDVPEKNIVIEFEDEE